MKKLLAVILSVLLLVLSIAGCAKNNADDTNKADDTAVSEDGASAADDAAGAAVDGTNEAYTFGFITLADTDVFCKSVCDYVVNEYVPANYPNCTVVTADGNADPSTQIQAAENFVAQKLNAVIIQAADADGSVAAVDIIREAGIPVIGCTSGFNDDTIVFVGSAHYDAGVLQAKYVIDNWDSEDTCRVLFLRGTAGLAHSQQRYDGFCDTLNESGMKYEILAEQDGDYLRTEGLRIMEDWIQVYGEDFDAVIASNDQMILGAVEAMNGANITGKITCGVDATADAIAEIQAGTLSCSIFQNGNAQGAKAVDLAYIAAGGGAVESFNVPFETVDASNAADYAA